MLTAFCYICIILMKRFRPGH